MDAFVRHPEQSLSPTRYLRVRTMNATSTGFAIVGFFVVADLVYALDHYFVHHDPARYRATHSRHHRRYNGRKDGRPAA